MSFSLLFPHVFLLFCNLHTVQPVLFSPLSLCISPHTFFFLITIKTDVKFWTLVSPLIWAWLEAMFPLYVHHLRNFTWIHHLPVSRYACVCLYKFIQEKSEALTLKTSVFVIILPYYYARGMFSLLRENSVVFFVWILLMVPARLNIAGFFGVFFLFVVCVCFVFKIYFRQTECLFTPDLSHIWHYL